MSDVLNSYFVAQSHRPAEIWSVDVTALPAFHRGLLVNDGTVTCVVEASALETVVVDVVDHAVVVVGDEMGSWLDLPSGASVLRRRVVIRGRQSGSRWVFAESLLVASRLPAGFIGRLQINPKGLGDVLAKSRLETRRELLWFGQAAAADWMEATDRSQPLLTRSYRLILGDCPAILITENFLLDAATDSTRY